MQIKTIFLPLYDAEQTTHLLPQAIAAAQHYGAHLDVLALGVDGLQTGFYYAAATAVLAQQALERAEEQARAILSEAQSVLKASQGLRWSVDSAVCQLVDVSRVVTAHGRFCDLAIVDQPYAGEDSATGEAVVEGALFGAAARVFILPQGAAFEPPRRISFAWNDSPEASAAMRGALPLLAAADLVKVVIIDPPVHGRDRSDPGGMVSEFLARHGCRVEIDVLSKSLPRVADVLLRHARDADVDLVVMGAYGHSRFREAIIGGATRHMLEQADLPVLMAHA